MAAWSKEKEATCMVKVTSSRVNKDLGQWSLSWTVPWVVATALNVDVNLEDGEVSVSK